MIAYRTSGRESPIQSFAQRQMVRLARAICRVFYERIEVAGEENIPATGPVLLCANHTNAIADAIILVAVFPRHVRPLARSGLFRMLGMRRLLTAYGAVPVVRGRAQSSDASRNEQMFALCFEALGESATLLIFPEGQSHTDPFLHPFKTGAARIALGARAANGEAPVVLPGGLSFTRKGHFRGSVLVNFGTPVAVPETSIPDAEQPVRDLTQAIESAVRSVTINTESWEQIELLKRIERFVALRGGRYRRRTLNQRFRALKRIGRMQHLLSDEYPEIVVDLEAKIAEFEQLCARAGVRDYHLTVEPTAMLLTVFFLRALLVVAVAFPIGVWGWLNAVVPFLLARHVGHWAARDRDQYDTAKMGFGALFFTLFWWGQTAWVYAHFGPLAAVVYLASLPLSAIVTWALIKERRRLKENLRALVSVLSGRRGMRELLVQKRDEIEFEVTELMRSIRRKWHETRRRSDD